MDRDLRTKKILQVRLPDEVEKRKSSNNDLLDDLVMPMRDIIEEHEGEPEERDNNFMVTTERTEESEENEEKQKYKESDSDEIPKEDFFETAEEKQEEYEIQGMDEVAADEDEEHQVSDNQSVVEDYLRRSVHAVRLSVHAQKFGEKIESDIKRTSRIPENLMEKPAERVETSEEEEREEAEEAEEEERRYSRRATRITILDFKDHQKTKSAPSIQTADFKPYTDEEDQKSFSQTSQHRASRMSQSYRGGTEFRESGVDPIYYEVESRVQDSETDLMQFFDLTQDRCILLDDFEQEGEEEEVITVAEEEPVALVREPYYQKYDELGEEIANKRIKNNVLQKKVTMYLKRRKVENFLKDGEPPLDQINKYNHKLDTYKEILEVNTTQRKIMTDELNGLKQKSTEQYLNLNRLFKSMQTREGNIGYGLIHTKTGYPIPDKLVERLIRRQTVQMEQVSSMRLKYIKLKGMVQEKLDAIDKIDLVENNLRLADYEQLKVENRSYSDKMEERDEELTRLRSKCQNTIQILAHMREKSAALETDLDDLRYEFDMADIDADQSRAHLADLKHQRDKIRNRIVQMKAESGLLTQPDLLRDMGRSQREIQKLEEELQHCKDDVSTQAIQIRNLRKHIEKRTEVINKKKAAKLRGKLSSVSSVSVLPTLSNVSKLSKSKEELMEPVTYASRTTLYMPIIKPIAFIDLVRVKPNPRTFTKKKR